ncbi:MAG: hypothetical protein OQK69_00620 [Gammaproteobacteria bacterium]|nr:hypothetical protein [Gammaproteobacteria bacterium]
MLLLPSGLAVGLSTNRAKYHALKKQHQGTKAKHQDLYSLVDIIIRHKDASGEIKRGWTEYDYYFSGYTLADIHLLTDWSSEDKNTLRHWIKQAEQYQRIETTRQRLEPFQSKLSTLVNPAPEHLHSTLKNRIKKLAQQQAPASQWLATINNMQQTGMRKEEIIWSGLFEFLKQQQDRHISKQQLLDAINFKNIRLELSSEQITGCNNRLYFREVARQMPHQAVYRASLKLDEDCICLLRHIDDAFNYRVGLVKTRDNDHYMALNKYWFALDMYGRAINNPKTSDLYFSSSFDAMAACNRHSRKHIGLESNSCFHHQYDYITLYGGEDYREWILSLPDYQRTFFGAHFVDHNVLAHVRTTTRIDINRRRLLFIEELQSDWHQSGHMHGYDNSAWGKVANAPFKKEWPALATKLMLIHACHNGFDGIAWPGGHIQETRYAKELSPIKRHYDVEMPTTLNRLGKPFKASVTSTHIATRDPWLSLVKSKNKWRVTDRQGKFETRDRYRSRNEALAVLSRHCRNIDLKVPVFYINEKMRKRICEQGLPMFGESRL